MTLATDAVRSSVILTDIAKKNINLNVLERIEDDLDIEEKLSILFLMINDYSSAFQEVFALFKKAQDQKVYIISELVKKHPFNWENKLLEAFCVCNNQKIIKNLGISFSDLQQKYLAKENLQSQNLNITAKCLYKLCEALTEEQAIALIKCVQADIRHQPKLDYVNHLELHILYWMEIKYISISLDGSGDLCKLLKHLKRFDDIEMICMDLEHCRCLQNLLQIEHDNKQHILNPADIDNVRSLDLNDARKEKCLEQFDVKKIEKGLCVIVNEMFFSGDVYEPRFGAHTDCLMLRRTFENFGFNVHMCENLKESEFIKKMESIPSEFGIDYDCLFFFVLSHGCKGSIITSDEQIISIEQIEQKLCCPQLKDVIKIVIIQACQGKITGQKNDLSLAIDGKSQVLDIAPYKNFGIFMSTMQGYVSIRHKKEGSWFIQDLCDILEQKGCTTRFSQIITLVQRSVECRTGRMDGYSVAQIPELRCWRLGTDFLFSKNIRQNN